MNTPRPNLDDHDSLSAALRRDAARIQEPPFDAALHHATLRHIRALAEPGAARWNWRLALAGTAALAVLALCIGMRLPRASQIAAHHAPPPDFAAVLGSAQTAVVSLSTDTPLPAWMSPTASLLDPPLLSSN